MYLMGIDSGEERTAFCLAKREGERLFVLKLGREENGSFLEELKGLFLEYAPLLVVLERP